MILTHRHTQLEHYPLSSLRLVIHAAAGKRRRVAAIDFHLFTTIWSVSEQREVQECNRQKDEKRGPQRMSSLLGVPLLGGMEMRDFPPIYSPMNQWSIQLSLQHPLLRFMWLKGTNNSYLWDGRRDGGEQRLRLRTQTSQHIISTLHNFFRLYLFLALCMYPASVRMEGIGVKSWNYCGNTHVFTR